MTIPHDISEVVFVYQCSAPRIPQLERGSPKMVPPQSLPFRHLGIQIHPGLPALLGHLASPLRSSRPSLPSDSRTPRSTDKVTWQSAGVWCVGKTIQFPMGVWCLVDIAVRLGSAGTIRFQEGWGRGTL